jgi:RimJ/RimL family protein N-acetyltransferase
MNLNLHSRRLTLAPYTQEDLDLSLEMFTDPQVVRYAGDVLSEQQVTDRMSTWAKRGGEGWIGIWTVSDRITGEKYGSVALLPMPIEEDETDYDLVVPGHIPKGDVEIGYYLKRSAWGFGYATEACRRLLQFAFEETPLTEVVATFHTDNLASRNVLEKSGFSDRGSMRCYGKDGVNFRITRNEWSRLQCLSSTSSE